MRSRLFCVLMGVGLLWMVSSCATVPNEPVPPGQMRLTGAKFPVLGGLKKNVKYEVNIKFEADGRPEVTRVCVYWDVYGPSCTEPLNVNYGTQTISAFVPTPNLGLYTFKAYVYYLRNEVSLRSNMVEIPGVNVNP